MFTNLKIKIKIKMNQGRKRLSDEQELAIRVSLNDEKNQGPNYTVQNVSLNGDGNSVGIHVQVMIDVDSISPHGVKLSTAPVKSTSFRTVVFK